MAPKKGKKITLGEFLVDSSLGSWADEMDALPNAPAARSDDDASRGQERHGRRDDFHSSRPERGVPMQRDDLPLPTQPPYTAFVGNLSFDLVEEDLANFFQPLKTKSIKIIKDRIDRPKGFGYIEFEDLAGLKDALLKSGSTLSGRTVRVSVAEPPKERHGSGNEDDSKFENPWRRDGPLPDRDPPGRRFEGTSHDRTAPSVSDSADDWRSNRPQRATLPDAELPAHKKKNSGFVPSESSAASAAGKEEEWSRGSKFKPTSPTEEPPTSRFGSLRSRPEDDGDWRRSRTGSRASPNSSTPPTPQATRRKLELYPRSGNASSTPSPLSSPKMGPAPGNVATKANPFGAAKPVDVTVREKEVSERLEKEKESVKDRFSMSRSNSRTASERPPPGSRTPPNVSGASTPNSPKSSMARAAPIALAPNVRPTLSFANVAASKKDSTEKVDIDEPQTSYANEVNEVVDRVAEATI